MAPAGRFRLPRAVERAWLRAALALPLSAGLAAGALLGALVLLLSSWAVAVVVGVLFAAACVGLIWRGGPALALWAFAAREPKEAELPRVRGAVEWLSASVGVDAPSVMVADCPGVMAVAVPMLAGGLATRRDGSEVPPGTIVVGRDVEALLPPLAIEALVAHELVRMRLLAPRTAAWGVLSPSILALVLGAGAPSLAERDRQLSLLADAGALSVTRYPPAMAVLLETMAANPPPQPRGRQRFLAAAWVSRPEEREQLLRTRLEALSEQL